MRWKVVFHFYIHHPGQLIRSLGQPNFKTFTDMELDESNNKLSIKLNHVSVLRKRPNANIPCDGTLQDDDTRFEKELVKQIGCIPRYWTSIMAFEDSFKNCTTSVEMANIFYAIENKKTINWQNSYVTIILIK